MRKDALRMRHSRHDVRSDVLDVVGRFSRTVNVRLLVLIVAGCIVVFEALGALVLAGMLGGTTGYNVLDLDAERTLPATFSSGLLLWGCLMAFALARAAARLGIRPALLRAFGVLLAYMGVDELVAIHEKLEAWVEVDWQVLYLPVALAAAVAWVGVLLVLRRVGRGALLLVGGALVWTLSQVLEAVEYGGFNSDGQLVAAWAALPEEILEMIGSALFAFALLLACRQIELVRARRSVRVHAMGQP
jgi:hypothetical protein